MKKEFLVLLGAFVAIAALAAVLMAFVGDARRGMVPFDPTNASYLVEGTVVTLVNGQAEVPAAPGSASTVRTWIFGLPAMGDLNGDGTRDAALLLVQNAGGSGTFYYAAAALATSAGAEGTNAILLGDRIAPQNISIASGTILVNYADRNAGEPMTTQPSLGVSKYFTVVGGLLEAAPAPGTPSVK